MKSSGPAIRKAWAPARHAVFLFIVVSTGITALLTSLLSYRNASRAAQESLKTQALGIAAALDPALALRGSHDEIFREVLTSERWEGIAFLALIAPDGTILMHSNRNLTGKKVPDVLELSPEDGPHYASRKLATGEQVFLMDAPLRLEDGPRMLRVALHTYPALKAVRQARLQLFGAASVVAVLFAAGGIALSAAKKKDMLSRKLAEREQFAALGEMAAVLAHEIRNPLGSIKGFAQYLSETASREEWGERASEPADIITAEAGRLEKLTEELLSYAQPDTLRIEAFDLRELLDQTIRVSGLPPSLRLVVACDIDGPVQCDKHKMGQILANLLRNAAEASPLYGTVEISAKQEDSEVIIMVRDSGPGIPEEIRAQIFRPFFTTKARGTGLGLAIVQRFAAAMGGTVSMMTDGSSGCAFVLHIPKVCGGERA